jgi:hypothetical protein
MSEFGSEFEYFKDGIYMFLSYLDDIHTSLVFAAAQQPIEADNEQEHGALTN